MADALLDYVDKDLARVSADKLIPELVALAHGIYGELGRTLTIEGSGGAAYSTSPASIPHC